MIDVDLTVLSEISLNSSLDTFLGDKNLLNLNPSHRESAFSEWQPKHIEPLPVASHNDSLIAFRSSNLLENTNSWVSKGQFGDSNGQEDVTLTIKDADDNIAETFSLTGDGYGEVFKDDRYEYVIFSGTNETTAVQISAINDLKLNDYLGSSLRVQTQGSITTEDIILENTAVSNSPELILQSGLSEVQNSAIGGSYKITDLNPSGNFYSQAHDINDSGQVVGHSYPVVGYNEGATSAFLYSDGRMTNLGILLGGINSYAHGINNSGQIVGDSTQIVSDSKGSYEQFRAFLYSDGQITYLGALPGDTQGQALDINDSGQVVGESFGSPRVSRRFAHAFLYSDGQMTNLDALLGGINSYAHGINNSGQVVGQALGSDRKNRAFFYSDGQMTDLGTLPGYNHSYAIGINDSGQVVGCSTQVVGYNQVLHRAFLYSDGQMTDLGILPQTSQSCAVDINNSGQVVGSADTNGYERHAFIYSDGQITDLNSLIPQDSGWTLTGANAINDRGQIVGQGIINGQKHAFLLDPRSFTSTPEDGITVGNISTKGDSILLNGLKITLTGPAITTNGGKMTFDGPTLIKSNTNELIFDSTVSADGSGGGDITFKDTLDGYSANTQSLIFKAGQGNITFSQAIGGKATVKDFTVNSAKTVTAEDINSDGDIILKVIDDISTANLSTNNSSKIKISLGKIDEQLYNSSGNVTIGSITAQEIDILSDGSFTAMGNIEALDGEVEIIALKDIAVAQIIAQNGATNLTSGTGAIAVTGTIESKNGFIALARQDITTGEIKSSQGVVILNTHQGAIAVNDTITAYDDVSLSAPLDVVAQEISSEDGGVALISASGTVTANGAIASMEDITLGAKENVVAQTINAQFGTIALVSAEGTVTANGAIYGSFGVEILARQNVSLGNLGSYEGAIVLESKQSTVTTGNVVTEGSDIYVFCANNLVLQNLISNGGAITIASWQGTVTTGYLRSDGYGKGKGGKIYLKAFGYIQVISSVNIDGIEYSIYTGVNKKGWLRIVPESSLPKSQKTRFVISQESPNGTQAKVSVTRLLSYQPPLDRDPIQEGLRLLEPLFRRILKLPPTEIDKPIGVPSHADEINPITNKPYDSPQERELVRKFTDNQIDEIVKYVNDSRYYLDFDEIEEKGEFSLATDEQNRRCFGIPLTDHLGNNGRHNKYATDVTGSLGDYILIPPTSVAGYFSVIYDGKVKVGSLATIPSPLPSQSFNAVGVEPIGALAEVKTGHGFLLRIINGNPLPARPKPGGGMYPSDEASLNKLLVQVRKEALVARACHEAYFLSFDLFGVARAGASLLNYRLAAQGIPVRVRYIEPLF